MGFQTQKISAYLGFARFVALRFYRDRCSQTASSLTYTTLLSLVPLATIALTVFAAFPVFDGLMAQLKVFLLNTLVPDYAGKVITVYLADFSTRAANLTMVGVVFLGVTSFLLLHTIEQAFNVIWRVRRDRSLVQRFLVYWGVITLGPLLVGGSLSLASFLVGISFGLGSGVSAIGVFTLKLIQLLLTVAAFSLLYLMVPNRRVPLRHALVGGVLAGSLFEVMKRGFAFYVTQFPTYTLVYGAFAAIPLFLLWIYLSWLMVLAGAELTAALAYWQDGAWRLKETPGRRFYDALLVLRRLMEAQRRGEASRLSSLRKGIPLGPEDIEDVLERLASAGMVQRLEKGGWVAVRNLEKALVSEIYRIFVITIEGVPEALPPTVHALARQGQDLMGITLGSLFAGNEAPT